MLGLKLNHLNKRGPRLCSSLLHHWLPSWVKCTETGPCKQASGPKENMALLSQLNTVDVAHSDTASLSHVILFK